MSKFVINESKIGYANSTSSIGLHGRPQSLYVSKPNHPSSYVPPRPPQTLDPVPYNDTKNVRIRLDTAAIRSQKYNFYTGSFAPGYPQNSVYSFCSKKISSVFKKGETFWSSSLVNNQISYKTSNFSRVVDKANIKPVDYCYCNFVDLSGTYTFDRSIVGSSQLLTSSNPKVENGSISLNLNPDYLDIKILSKTSSSLIWIRLRPPLRWRRAYEDWTFNEFLQMYSINNTETEFVKVINCCDTTTNSVVELA